MLRPTLLLALVLTLAAAHPAAARDLVVVQANVGNVNVPGCQDQVYKLCLRPVEQRGAQALRALGPDVVGFQEILPPELCARAPSSNPSNLCSGPLEPRSQVERLLGPGYRVACDGRFGWDCIAVRGALTIDGGLDTRAVPRSCEDPGFTMNAARLRLHGWPIAAAVAHPSSTDAECRADQVRDLLSRALPPAGPALVLGDFNLDPYRESDASVQAWREFVPSRYTALSGDELTSFPGAPSQTDPSGEALDGDVAIGSGPLAPRTIDHVIARDLRGSCRVERIDGGGGMDHRAQVCRVGVGPEVAPRLRLSRRGCRLTARFAPAPPGLRGVRFAFGSRVVVDRRAPYAARQRRGERRLAVQALLPAGEGPLHTRRLRACR